MNKTKGCLIANFATVPIAASRASTCGLATPKDPSDCNKRCGLYAGKPCSHYRTRVAAEPVIAEPLTRICPNQRFALLDDGMGELARVPADAWAAAHYHAYSGDVH